MKPVEPTAPQAQRVLLALRQAYPGGTCLRGFGPEAYTARNRVGDLRKLGWDIIAERCREHKHSGTVARYYLLNPHGTKEGAKQVTVGRDDDLTGREPGEAAATASPLPLFPDEPYRRTGAAL